MFGIVTTRKEGRAGYDSGGIFVIFGNYVNRFCEKFGELSNYHTHTDDTTAHVPSTLTGTALAFNSVRIKLGKAPKWADMQV